MDELRQAVKEDRLVLLPVERLLAGSASYTQREIAEESGFDLEHLAEFRQALGLATPDPDARVYTDEDLETAKDAAALAERASRSTRRSRYARARPRDVALRGGAARAVRPDLPRARRQRGRARAAAAPTPPASCCRSSSRMLDHVFLLHIRQVPAQRLHRLAERTPGKVSDTSETTVAFADLVGITELGETVGVEELGGLAGRLSKLAGDVVEPPVRVVKQIGDAVMLVSPDARAAVETCLALVERAEGEEDFPPLRAGVAYGPAVNRWGDWFGSTSTSPAA